MSLLMQALKKAENAKQKQDEQAEDAAGFTVEPSVFSESDSLTLQPQEPSPAEQRETAAQQEEPSPPVSALDYFSTAAVEPATPTHTEPQAGFEADSGFSRQAIPGSSTPGADTPQPTARTPDKGTPVDGGTHGKLKIGLNEKQSAAIEAKKKLAARNAAKSVFNAKQKSPNRRAIIIALLGLTILAIVGAYGYTSMVGIGRTPVTNVVAIAPQPVTEPVPGVAPPVDPLAQAGRAMPESAAAGNTNAIAESLPATPSAGTMALPATTTTAALPSSTPVAPLMPTPDYAAPVTSVTPSSTSSAQPQLSVMRKQSDAIKIRRSDASVQLNPALSSAYQTYMAGDLTQANSQYQKVLQQDPNNRDALLGIAAIAIDRGQNAKAGAFYKRLLELDPHDAEAAAGIVSLDQNDPSTAESRLKNILAQNPNSGSTLFALGNVYAEQSRWSEAQQFYFRAFGTASGNADYAYNLAISLDRLGQSKLALEYYQRALQLAQKSGGNLDKATVTNRIHALQSLPQT